ncbi:hypothetical protein RQP46_006075 [Phenoliferia psychrophenolica]
MNLVQSGGRSTLVPLPPPTPDPRLLSPPELSELGSQLTAANPSSATISSEKAIEYANQLFQHALAATECHEKDKATLLTSVSQHYAARERERAERHALELAQLQSQARALARKIVESRAFQPAPHLSSSTRNGNPTYATPRDYDDSQLTGAGGSHWDGERYVSETEVEADNRKLLADVRRLQQLLGNSDTQVKDLSRELHKLRAYLLTATPLIATDSEVVLPPPPHLPLQSTSLSNIPDPDSHPDPPRKSRLPTMGDAESELLLLAGKQLSHVRRINRVPLSSAIALQAHEILNVSASVGVVPSAHTPPPADHDPSPSLTPKAKARKPPGMRSSPHSPYKSRPPTTPRRTGAGPSTSKAPSTTPAGTPSFGGMDDLIQAAQSVLVPSASPPPKRRKLSPSLAEAANWATAANGSGSGGGEGLDLSALDLLAQASSSQEEAAKAAAVKGTEMQIEEEEEKEEVEVDDALGLEPSFVEAERERLAVAWNISEDQLLIQAVLLHGQRWDLIAAMVPTRSYHQCRQRWLRGLKNGDALPEELMHLQASVQKVLREFPCYFSTTTRVQLLCQDSRRAQALRAKATARNEPVGPFFLSPTPNAMATFSSLASEILLHILRLSNEGESAKEEQRSRFSFGLVARAFYLATADATNFYVAGEAQAKALASKLELEGEPVAQDECATRSSISTTRVSNVRRLTLLVDIYWEQASFVALMKFSPNLDVLHLHGDCEFIIMEPLAEVGWEELAGLRELRIQSVCLLEVSLIK